MRWAAAIVVIVLAAGCTTPPPSADEDDARALVVLADEHAAGFRVDDGRTSSGETRREEPPPSLPEDPSPPPGEPPAPPSGTAPATSYWGDGSTDGGPVGNAGGTNAPARPLRFTLGPDASPGPYVVSVTLSDDASAFSASLRAVSEATTRIGALVVLRNPSASAANVTLTAPQVNDSRITGAWLLVDGARVDLFAVQPTVALTMAPESAVDVGLELALGRTRSGETLPTWTVQMDVSTS